MWSSEINPNAEWLHNGIDASCSEVQHDIDMQTMQESQALQTQAIMEMQEANPLLISQIHRWGC